jgi:hypothetical protein
MSSKFCRECGKQLGENELFCSNCGTKVLQTETVQEQPQQGVPNRQEMYSGATQYQSPNYQQPNQGMNYQQFGYREHQFPPNYQPTDSAVDRIVGTLKRDEHVIEEIEYRKELQQEAIKLLIVNFLFLSFVRIITVFTVSFRYEVYLPLGAIVEIILTQFIGGLAFIYAVASIGGSIGGSETQTDRDEMIRVLSYAYVARVIENLVSLIDDIISNPATGIIWVIVLIWSALVVLKAIKQALDKGYGTAIISVVIAFIVQVIANGILVTIVESIFGGTTYDVIG